MKEFLKLSETHPTRVIVSYIYGIKENIRTFALQKKKIQIFHLSVIVFVG